MLVADRENRRVQLFTGSGRCIGMWAVPGHPHSLYRTPDQTLYVGGLFGLYIYTLDGKPLGRFNRHGRQKGRIYEAHMVAVDCFRAIYEADASAKRV